MTLQEAKGGAREMGVGVLIAVQAAQRVQRTLAGRARSGLGTIARSTRQAQEKVQACLLYTSPSPRDS